MIQGNTWHEYSNELKHFLCDVAKSRWARYLFYPLGVFVAIMYTTSQAGAHSYSFFSMTCGAYPVRILPRIIRIHSAQGLHLCRNWRQVRQIRTKHNRESIQG